jgi:hypothetical protein
MTMTRALRAAFLIAALAAAGQAHAADVRLQAREVLDEPFHYCLDLAGGPNNVDLTQPIGGHACKGGDFSDQIFDSADLTAGKLRLPLYERCLQTTGEAGASAAVVACADVPKQRWVLDSTGGLHPASAPNLCLTIRAGPGRVAGSPPGVVYHATPLTLEICEATAAARQGWRVEVPTVPNKRAPPRPS